MRCVPEKLKCKFKFTVHKFLDAQPEEKWPVISSFEKLRCAVALSFSVYTTQIYIEEKIQGAIYKFRFALMCFF